MVMKSDERFDFVVFGSVFNLENNVNATIKTIVYQKTIDEVAEMLGKPVIDKEHGSGMVAQTFMLKSDYEAANKNEKRWW